MARRTTRGAMAGAVVLALALVTACTPGTDSTSTPTGFASEEEAFAAAEATYRAYIDAVNARREDPDSSPDPTDFLTGDALESSLDGARKLEDSGRHIAGPAQIKSLDQVSASASTAILSACIDSSQTRVIDTTGADVTPADRPNTLALQIEVVFAEPRPLVIRSEADGAPEC